MQENWLPAPLEHCPSAYKIFWLFSSCHHLNNKINFFCPLKTSQFGVQMLLFNSRFPACPGCLARSPALCSIMDESNVSAVLLIGSVRTQGSTKSTKALRVVSTCQMNHINWKGGYPNNLLPNHVNYFFEWCRWLHRFLCTLRVFQINFTQFILTHSHFRWQHQL